MSVAIVWINEKDFENCLSDCDCCCLKCCIALKIIHWFCTWKRATSKKFWKTFRICEYFFKRNAWRNEKSFKVNCCRHETYGFCKYSPFIECCSISWWYGDTYGDCKSEMTSNVKKYGRSTWWHREMIMTCKPNDSRQSLNRNQSNRSTRRICKIFVKNSFWTYRSRKETSTCERCCETVKERTCWNVRTSIDNGWKIASCERTARKYEEHNLRRIVASRSESSWSNHADDSESCWPNKWTPKTDSKYSFDCLSNFLIDCNHFLTCTCIAKHIDCNLSFELTYLTNHLSCCIALNSTSEQSMMNTRKDTSCRW